MCDEKLKGKIRITRKRIVHIDANGLAWPGLDSGHKNETNHKSSDLILCTYNFNGKQLSAKLINKINCESNLKYPVDQWMHNADARGAALLFFIDDPIISCVFSLTSFSF